MGTKFSLNGATVEPADAADTPLLWVIRDSLGFKGTKFGCGIAQCGACTVHIDGRPARACVTPLAAAAGREVTTIEGLDSTVGTALKQAWIEAQVPQCGYCQSGQLMQAAALLEREPAPDDQVINETMIGNLCRCMAYTRIRAAIRRAAARLQS